MRSPLRPLGIRCSRQRDSRRATLSGPTGRTRRLMWTPRPACGCKRRRDRCRTGRLPSARSGGGERPQAFAFPTLPRAAANQASPPKDPTARSRSSSSRPSSASRPARTWFSTTATGASAAARSTARAPSGTSSKWPARTRPRRQPRRPRRAFPSLHRDGRRRRLSCRTGGRASRSQSERRCTRSRAYVSRVSCFFVRLCACRLLTVGYVVAVDKNADFVPPVRTGMYEVPSVHSK